MNKAFIFLCLFFIPLSYSFAQDSLYVMPYVQKMSASLFVANNALLLQQGSKEYSPNNPLTVGVGFAIKNTVVNTRLSYGVADLKGKEYGRTRIFDFQLHNYGRKFILDLFIQNYKGFYTENRIITTYPDISVQHIGAEASYLFNGNKFLAKAAFQQSEKQLQSAGSFVAGGGIYGYRLKLGSELSVPDNKNYLDNLQFGVNGGYAYSYVLNPYWLLSGMATVGANVGNNPEAIKGGKLKMYPTAFARGAASYNKPNWAVAFAMLIHNKSVYAVQDTSFTITALSMQLTYVRRFDGF